MNRYKSWCKWHPLKAVMLGRCYPAEFYQRIRNDRIRSALQRIAEETEEDLENFQSVLRSFGCEVTRPHLSKSDDIMNFIDDQGRVAGNQGVPRAPLQVRDSQLVVGERMVIVNLDHGGILKSLMDYNRMDMDIMPMMGNENTFIAAPSITIVGRDIYADQLDGDLSPEQEEVITKHHPFRINRLRIGGHSDGCFHTLKPGALISLTNIQTYEDTFPGWDVCFLEHQGWSRMEGFLRMKNRVRGRWWVPGEESNDEFTDFVETWLNDWVGYCEETVFDVNVLMLDDRHVCVNNHNEAAFGFFRKHGIEPIIVPWRHRYFWDGGLHCITLDLYREGKMEDYFPDRLAPINDPGFD